MTVLFVAELLVLVILAAIAGSTIIVTVGLAEFVGVNSKKGRFDWLYNKLLYSYKIKVLHDELKARDVDMEELNEIMYDALGKKSNKKHVLTQVEEEVTGEVEDASPPKTSGKK